MKKKTPFLLIVIIGFNACDHIKNETKSLTEQMIVSGENLIPGKPGTTPSYWCTWSCQNYAIDSITVKKSLFGIEGHSVIARNLTEERVFGKNGWAKSFAKIQQDIYLMFDLGWDIPRDMNFDDSRWELGSQYVADDKFPSCNGTPVERLKKLNERAKAVGWRGAGIWIPAQAWNDGKNNKMASTSELERYYRERAQWANQAGIEYWKVDYGARGGSIEYRQLVSKIAAEEAPNLWVEHCTGGGPLNDFDCPWDCPSHSTGEFAKWCNGLKLQTGVQLLEFSQILRTYDVTAFLSIPTTIDRVAQILNGCAGHPHIKGILNCEDEPYIAASLNCMIGIMRHPAFLTVKGFDYNPLQVHKRCDEVIRAVRWQRIAPATGAGFSSIALDSVRLKDNWLVKRGESWATWLEDKIVQQSAPARIAKNMPLPVVVCQDEPPYVLASKHSSGAITIATLCRHHVTKGFYFPLADITIQCENAAAPIAVFGKYKSLTLKFAALPLKFKIYAQDLAGDIVYDITEFVKKNDNSLILSGKWIETVGLSAASFGDISDPGLVLKIVE
jgi:hypothetical protein